MIARALALLAVLSITACGGWWGLPDQETIIPGERKPALLLEPELRPDPAAQSVAVVLPPPTVNADWPQAGGDATHAMHHLAGANTLRLAWRQDIGTTSGRGTRVLARPIVAGGRVFVIDAVGRITALAAADGREVWSFTVDSDDLGGSRLGGGLAYENGWVFAALSSGLVLGLNADTGTEVWRRKLGVPIRAAPAVAGRSLLVLTADNQLWALDGTTGEPLWRHAGFFEPVGLLGGPTPAVSGQTVIVPYSSGEVFAIRLDTGEPLWADAVQRPRVTLATGQINDIDGHPVIDRDQVYVVGQGGEMVAIEFGRGTRIWEQELASSDTPWVAGDFIYVLTSRSEVAALLRDSGRVRWVSPLPRLRDPNDIESDPVVWQGPVLVGDRLLLANSAGEAVSMSPYTGEILGRISLPAGVQVPPVVANGTVFLLTTGGDLLAYR